MIPYINKTWIEENQGKYITIDLLNDKFSKNTVEEYINKNPYYKITDKIYLSMQNYRDTTHYINTYYLCENKKRDSIYLSPDMRIDLFRVFKTRNAMTRYINKIKSFINEYKYNQIKNIITIKDEDFLNIQPTDLS